MDKIVEQTPSTPEGLAAAGYPIPYRERRPREQAPAASPGLLPTPPVVVAGASPPRGAQVPPPHYQPAPLPRGGGSFGRGRGGAPQPPQHHQQFAHAGGQETPAFAAGRGRGGQQQHQQHYPQPPPPMYHSPPRQPARPLQEPSFVEYLTEEQVHEGLRNGTILQGKLRVNQKKPEEAYVAVPSLGRDVLIAGHPLRNRAVHGETVAISLFSVVEQMSIQRQRSRSPPSALRPIPAASAAPEHQMQGLSIATSSADAVPAAAPATPEPVINIADAAPANRAGRVVAIIESKRDQVRVGRIIPFKDNPSVLNFIPLDPKYPKMIINHSSNVPGDVIERRRKAVQLAQLGQRPAPGDTSVGNKERELFCFTIRDWPVHSKLPVGAFSSYLGEAGSIEVDTKAILLEHGVDRDAFSPEALADIAQFQPRTLEDGTVQPWAIPADERARRLDLTHLPIVTCDPATARDLDDALSIEPAEPFNGDKVYRIGVHIADVSYFVRPGTALDKEARERSSTVYMPHRAYPMLPELLSSDLCSLNPGVDRLAFSSFWYMTEDGRVLSEDDRHKPLFARSIINCVAKLNYDLAQEIIDGAITKENALERLPLAASSSQQQLADQVVSNVTLMNRIAVLRRQWRFDHGAMAMNRGKKLLFAFADGDETKQPTGFKVYPIKDSNRMVEEYMLLSNEFVAKQLASAAPECALLRKHDAPHSHKLEMLGELLFGRVGLPKPLRPHSGRLTRRNFYNHVLDLMAYVKKQEGADADLSEACASTIMFLATANMQPALYKGPYIKPSSLSEEEEDIIVEDDVDQDQSVDGEQEAQQDSESFRHYALAMDFYTHFTSPIRRYPDVIVHRVLAWTLDQQQQRSASASSSASSLLSSLSSSSKAPEWIVREATVANALDVAAGITQVMGSMCGHCNDIKTASRRAQDHAEILFLCMLLKQQCSASGSGYVTDDAIVTGVGADFLKVVLRRYAVEAEIRWDNHGKHMLRRGMFQSDQGFVHVHWKRDYLSSAAAAAASGVTFTNEELHRLVTLGTRKANTSAPGALPTAEIDIQYRIFDRVPVRIVVDDSDIPMKLHVTLDVPQRGHNGSLSAADALAPHTTLPADLTAASFRLALPAIAEERRKLAASFATSDI